MAAFCAMVSAFTFACVHALHHGRFAGPLALGLGMALVAAIPTFVNEVNAVVEPSRNRSVAWREHKRRPTPDENAFLWVVRCAHNADTVEVSIARGSCKRVIGKCDPITDEFGFRQLKARAELAADAYNDEGVAA